jgi:hypothetical protein
MNHWKLAAYPTLEIAGASNHESNGDILLDYCSIAFAD